MATLPYMQFFPSDWMADCQVLSLAARGAWQTIICKAWHPTTKGVVTMRIQALARLFGGSVEEAETVLFEISETGVGDVITNPDGSITIICRRAKSDWEVAEKRHSSLSEAGKRGAEKRFGKKDSHANGEANSHPIERPIAIQKPEARIQNIPPKPPKPPKDRTPTTEPAKRIAALFNRRLATAWSEKEVKAFKALGEVAPEDLDVIERYYAAERAKGEENGRHRRDLLTFLNHFPGELDRARVRPAKPEANAAARKASDLVARVEAYGSEYGQWLDANYPPEIADRERNPATAREDALRGFLKFKGEKL